MPLYLSESALEELKRELQTRKTTTRREIAERISIAKDLGDLSENFEYTEAKEDQGTNEVRIIQIEDMLKAAIVLTTPTDQHSIVIGSSFVAKLKDGTEKTFSVVGSLEADPLKGRISHESPLGRAFIGHNVGDVVEISVPSGVMSYTIVSIS